MKMIVIYDKQGCVFIDMEGDVVEMSPEEAREVAQALLETAERCRVSKQPDSYSLGA